MKKSNLSSNSSHKRGWDLAILALMQNATREDAAKAANIDPATLYRWLKSPEFQKALFEARSQAFSHTTGLLQQASNAAVDTLIRIMNDQGAPAGGRVQAAKCVLELSRKSLELDDLRMQVAELQRWRSAELERSHQDDTPSTGN